MKSLRGSLHFYLRALSSQGAGAGLTNDMELMWNSSFLRKPGQDRRFVSAGSSTNESSLISLPRNPADPQQIYENPCAALYYELWIVACATAIDYMYRQVHLLEAWHGPRRSWMNRCCVCPQHALTSGHWIRKPSSTNAQKARVHSSRSSHLHRDAHFTSLCVE